VLLYGDTVTESMRRAITETDRRRTAQLAYNTEHDITPETVRKAIRTSLAQEVSAHRIAREAINAGEDEYDREQLIVELEAEMLAAAEELEFERAAALRDRIAVLKEKEQATANAPPKATGRGGRQIRRSRA